MCGKETSGLSAAEPTLYRGALWVLVPLPRTPPAALRLAHELAEGVGAHPLESMPIATIGWWRPSAACPTHWQWHSSSRRPRWQTRTTRSGGWRLRAFAILRGWPGSDVDMILDILMTNRAAVGEALTRAWPGKWAPGRPDHRRRRAQAARAPRVGLALCAWADTTCELPGDK